ncbi:MAG: hypothetical protein AAFX09_04355 [Pseudomonadota bacterium]
MANKKRETARSEEPEPVDAEFEPADLTDQEPARSKRGGPGWFLVIVFIVLAASIGGGAAYLIDRILGSAGAPSADPALEARLVALETGLAAAPQDAELDALQSRIAALETAYDTLGLRSDALASLDERVGALENASPTDADSPGDQAGLDALEARLTALEAELAAGVESSRLAQASADNALSAVQTMQTLLAQSSLDAQSASEGGEPGAAAIDPALIAELATLSARLEALNTEQAETRAAADAATETAANAAAIAETAAEQVEQLAAQPVIASVSDPTAERALALTALSDAVTRSAPFEAERAALARLWADAPGLAALEPIARAGAPTRSQLEAGFPRDAMLDAAGARRSFFGLVQLTPAAPQVGVEDPVGLIAAAQTRLAQGDLAGAAEAASRLDGAPAEAVQAWLLSARARLQTETTLAGLRAALSEEVSP